METPRASETMKKRAIQTIFVTGGGGFVGGNFLAHPPSGYRIVAPHHGEVDILDKRQLAKIFTTVHPDIVINFAAFRNATAAEAQRGNKNGDVWRTNVTGVTHLRDLARIHHSFLIHISTDMVFGGSPGRRGPFRELDTPDTTMDMLSWYGWTKAEAERALSGTKNTAIIRIGNVTQPIYDPTRDYVGKIAYLHDQKKLYPLFTDQYLTMTAIPSLLSVIGALIRQKKRGVFHVGSTNVFTPHELGRYLVKNMGRRETDIRGIQIVQYLAGSPHRYPQFGGLDVRRTAARLGVRFTRWQTIVDRYIAYAARSVKK